MALRLEIRLAHLGVCITGSMDIPKVLEQEHLTINSGIAKKKERSQAYDIKDR